MTVLSKIASGAAIALTASIMSISAADAKNFKIAVGDSGGSSQEATGKAFVEALEELSGGEHTGTLFLNGQLGSEQDTVNEAAIGTLDMSILAINNVTPFSPTVGVFSLPYVILSLEDAEKLTQGPIGQELTENTINDAGVRIIAWTYTGFRRLTNSKKPVKSVADLQGLVIRVPKNEIMIDTYKAWGISPTPMAWSETFAGLQTQVVDGQDNPYTTINAMKFYEVQKYVTNIRYIFSIEPLIISEQVFQGLSAEEQEMILEAGKKATAASAQFLRDNEAEIKQILLDEGMQIDDPENNEEEFIKLATEAVWPKFYDSIGGIEKMNAVLAEIGREPVSE
ncbi:TRAP transporter substrate-binding protein [Litoreibacter arenae]|uniref:TRAP-type C4-dicarboxylate transport system, periplasmic component / putative Taurine transporter n=1 Tax=Litoreibacter arenae DSM 19593 TaxID=1123360 RepID=S9RX54_9RHOB|nr:TRAP transporter substrate-binding protein [Litoreibacter arenae]EPX78569.1 TRAP-type C4-dicarboxylate transport system, periplasmic component / putative Taurine transporter [Litoreibacter arenae DSM 19593]